MAERMTDQELADHANQYSGVQSEDGSWAFADGDAEQNSDGTWTFTALPDDSDGM